MIWKPLLIGLFISAWILFFLSSLMKSAHAADTNTVSSTVVTDKSVPTASAPSVVVNNSDICKTATSVEQYRHKFLVLLVVSRSEMKTVNASNFLEPCILWV